MCNDIFRETYTAPGLPAYMWNNNIVIMVYLFLVFIVKRTEIRYL